MFDILNLAKSTNFDHNENLCELFYSKLIDLNMSNNEAVDDNSLYIHLFKPIVQKIYEISTKQEYE